MALKKFKMAEWPPSKLLGIAAGVGFVLLVVGVAIALLTHGSLLIVTGVVFQSLGSAILFPILVSVVYDRLRERWFGDEVWRLFGDLSDAGITRIYRDRELYPGRDNAQDRLASEFEAMSVGEVLMMGPTLRVFFNPLGPFYRDLERMIEVGKGQVVIRALIERKDSSAVAERNKIEEPNLPAGAEPQTERDAASSISSAANLRDKYQAPIEVRRFMPAPYCTAVIFPHVAYYSPNLLAPVVPVRMPMILFRNGSHGYKMLVESFNFLWDHDETQAAVA